MAGKRSGGLFSTRRAKPVRPSRSSIRRDRGSRLRLEPLEERALLAFDPTFGNQGIVITPVQPSQDDFGNAMKVLSDNRILVAGNSVISTTNQVPPDTAFSLAQYTPDGALDTTFGSGGKVVQQIGLSKDMANAVDVQSTGKIIVTGYSWINFGDLGIVNLAVPTVVASPARAFQTSDIGSVLHVLDNQNNLTRGWIPGDYTIVDVANGLAELDAVPFVNAVTTLPTNGQWSIDHFDFSMIRLNANGSLDTSFGRNGIVITSGALDNFAFSMLVQPDDRIVMAGYTNQGTATSPDFDLALVRYNSDGTLDTTFGQGGVVVATLGSTADFINSVALQSDGKIVVAGSSTVNGVDNMVLVRYLANGTRDVTFGISGATYTRVGSINTYANNVQIAPSGAIVVAGSSFGSRTSGPATFVLAQYQTNGVLDPNFGAAGTGIVQFTLGTRALANSVGFQSDGKIVVAGSSQSSGRYSVLVSRFNADGTPDTTFTPTGIQTDTLGTGDAFGGTVGLQKTTGAPDKIIVAGSADAANFDFAVARYVGSGDSTSNGGGSTTASTWHNTVLPLDVTADGQITPLDALNIINDLNARGARLLATRAAGAGAPYLDVNNDGRVTPQDALMVINRLNAGHTSQARVENAAAVLGFAGSSTATQTLAASTLSAADAPTSSNTDSAASSERPLASQASASSTSAMAVRSANVDRAITDPDLASVSDQTEFEAVLEALASTGTM